MSGGGGFRGRGFASRGHRRQGAEHHDSRGGNARSQGPSSGRAGFRGGGSRSNAPSDGGNIQGGVGKFRGDGIGGQNRQSFNLPRGPPMRQSQIPDNGWSPIPGNNWSGNNWSDNNMGNNWSENNMGNNWSKNNMGNTWMDNNTGNNWPDNNPRNNWSGNNPGNNWSPRGVGPPPPRGFRPWGGGCPTRFNGPPMPSFHRPPYGFQPPIGQNYLPPSIVDYPSNVEPESQNTSKPSNFSPKAPQSKKPAATAPKPQKQIVHPGSEEERLQKITEAADKLKRTLSTNKKGNSTSETWYMDDDIDTFGFASQQDTDHEPRMANRGIPELKHDPPELNLTLNDLRDIGRVDHDHTSRGTKSSNDADPNVDESEVEILEHNPVERVPEATIDIDLWPEDNPEDSTTNQLVETNDDTGVFDETFESTIQPFVDDTSKILHEDNIPLTAERDDSKCGEETIPKENEDAPEGDEQVTEDSAQDNQQQTSVNDDTQNVQLDDDNIVGETPSSQTEEETKIIEEHYHEHLHDKNPQMEEATIEDVSIHRETRTETENVDGNNVVEDIVLSTVVETEQIDDDDIEKCENSKISTESSVEIGETTSKTSIEENIDDESKMEKIVEEVEAISDEKTNTSDSIKETRDETNISLKIHDEVESEKTTTDEKTLEIPEEMTIESEKLVSSDDSGQNNEETYESHVESSGGKEKVVNESAVDTRRSEQNDNNDSCDSVVTNKITEEELNTSTMKSDNVETKEITRSDETVEQSQREREAKEKLAADKKKMIDRNAYKISASIEYSSSSRAYRNSTEIKTNIDKNIDSRIREKVKEKCAEVRDNKRSDRAERGHEKSSNSKSERKKLEEADRKSQERRKLVRSGHDNSSSRNRKSTMETTLRNSNESPSSSAGDEASPTVAHHQSQHDQSSVSSRFENPSYASSSSGKRSKEEILPVSTKFNRKERAQTANITEVREDPIESVLPPAFDPRLSSRERSVLISSSIPMNQDYTMTSGYPPCTMTNLVPSVPTINYAVPVGVPPALQIPPPLPLTATTPIMTTSIEPATNISSICMSDPFAPILPLPNPPPIVLPNELMIQPPLPVGLPPPPPPPAKAIINMEAELEDMQEAMEFAKQLMNMNDDSLESPSNDVLDADISDECDFFHMPTFPDLPPIELPPVPPIPPVPVPPVQTVRTDHPTTNKESVKKIENDNTTGISYGPAPMPEEYQENLSQDENTGESSGLTEEQLRPKVVFNLNTKSKIINKQHDEWHQQNQPDEGPQSLAPFVSAVAKSVVTEIGENRKNKANPTSLVTVTSKEKSRSTNGRMEERNKKHDEQAVSTKNNGKIDSPSYSPRTKTSLEETESRSLTPPKSGIQAKINKRDEDTPRNNRANKSETLKRSLKETPVRSSSNDPQTPESSWKSRVIGRFLKMSKNDIGNMLNNASLRKFDIAMKHLVKERRSSLSLEMRNNEEERMKDADERCYNREEFMDQLSAMLDPSATVDVCNLPTQFIHHLSQVLHLDTMSEFESPHNSVSEKTIGDVSSPALESSPNSESRKQRLGFRETMTTTTTTKAMTKATTTSTKTTKNDVAHEQDHREKKASKEKHVVALEEAASATTATTTIAAGGLNKDKVISTSEKTIVTVLPKPATNSRIENLGTRAVIGPRSKRRRAARVTVEKKEQSTTINNGQTSIENNSSSLNMADLDDIFSAGIARAKKKSHDLPIVRTAKKNEEEALNPEKKIVPTISCVDPSVVDRVERAAVELDEIFSAGIARAKLASKKVAEAAKSTEEGIEETNEANDNNVNDDNDDDDDDERVWNSGNLRTSADCLQLSRGRSSSSGRKAGSNNEKWSRQIHPEEPVAFRNLTKEEWEAKYSEPSYSTYQREYRAMEALREKRFQRSPSSGSKPDYNAFDINDLGTLKARLGECLSGNLECDENWSESNDLSRVRSINEAMNYTLEFNRSGDESSSTTSSSTSTSSNTSGAEDDEAPPSVTKLLKVIKEREKIAKQKTFNEEIRDEVTAEIERKKREREKVRKRHRTKPKKSSHHRRRREKKGKTRERKKRDRKRSKKQRKSRRSDQDSKESSSESEDSGDEEEHMSTGSHGRRRRRRRRHHHHHHHHQQQQQQQHSPERLLNEDEIKKEVVVKEEPDPEIVQPNENTSATKIVTSVKPVDDSRPASTTSSSSVPSISVAPSTTGQIIPLHQTKTKAQLKQMPVDIAKKLVVTADTNVSCEETAKNQAVTTQVTSFNENRENLVKNILPVASEISNVSDESNVSTSATNLTTVTTPPVSIQPIAAPSDDSAFKTNSKKLDIKTYKERARQRQLKQKEEIRLLIENPSSLTQNLLNIPPLTRKKEEEPSLVRSTTETTNAPEVLKDPRLKKLDETSNSRINVVVAAASLDSKVSNSTTISNDVASLPNSTAKITLAPSNIEGNPSTPPPSKVSSRIKIKRSNFTNARTNKLSTPLTSAKDLPGDTGKFAHIKSEGRKELKLREKLKRERFLTSTETPETSESSVVVPPTRLKRRKSLVTTEKMIPATELKTNRVPSSSKLNAICDNFETLETNEIANQEIRDDETPSVSKDPNLKKSSDGSKNTMAVTTNLEASPNPGTGSDEPKISDNVDTLYDVNPVISPFHHNSSSLLETTEMLKTSTSLEPPTEALLGNISTDFDGPESFVNSKIIKEISNNSTSPDPPKISSENSITDSSSLENLKNSNVTIQRDNTEISNTEKSVDIFEILESRTSWTNVQDFNAKELAENVDDVPDIPDTLEEIENSEIAKINETLEAAPDESKNLDSGTTSPPETSVILSEITRTMDESKALNASEELSKSVESTENEIQDRLPSVTKEMEKNDSILTETSLMPLEMPIEELPVWSLEAPAITSNIRDSHDYSNDSIPFKGFTDETILRRDRVLTEAEITEDSELNTFESVPLNFVGETATSTADNIDLDEITNTDVVDSLDDLPLPYSEQFQNAQDGIETSLPDPLGHTIYTVADEIVDVPPVTIPLEPLQTFAKESDQKDQLIEIVRTVAESSLPVDNLSRIDDFRVEIVNTRETVPSPILVVEAPIESKESSIPESIEENKIDDVNADANEANKIEEINVTESRNEATEVTILPEELSMNESQEGMKNGEIEPGLSAETEASNIDGNVVIPSGNDRCDEIKLHSGGGSNDNNFVEDETKEVGEVNSVAEFKNEIAADNESSSKICDTRDDKIDEENATKDKDDKEDKEAETRETMNCHQDKHDSESKSKDSSHHSKEHGHGRVKKKSSRNHNHGSKTSKKTTLTEKLVEDAITANVVRLVPKANSRQTVMARMMEIDVEIHKLMNEKMTLYKMLESGDFTSTESQDSVEKTIEQAKMTSEKVKEMEAGRASFSAPSASKMTEETAKKPEAKSLNLEIVDKTKKRKKSPHRESKHRSGGRDSAEPRRERKISESKSLTSSREKSTSLTDLEDTEEKRRKRDKSPARQSSKHSSKIHSSREDGLDVSRDIHKAEKSTKNAAPVKPEKTKKMVKPPTESKKLESCLKKSKNREVKSSSEKTIKISRPEHIYSDESNFESLQEPNESSKNQESADKKENIGSSTGLALLEESLKREMAHHRKTKHVEKRKRKREELRRSLVSSTVLTASEAKTGLINLFQRKKLKNKENSTSSETRDKTKIKNPGRVSKHVSSIIDAVATNRVQELYHEDSRASPARDETPKITAIQENRGIEDEPNKQRIADEERVPDKEENKEEEKEKEETNEAEEKEIVSRSPDEPTNEMKKVQHTEETEKTINDSKYLISTTNGDSVREELHEKEKEQEESNHEEFNSHKNLPLETEIPDIPKTPDIVEENMKIVEDCSLKNQEDYIPEAEMASNETSVKPSRTESRMEKEEDQEKQVKIVVERRRSVTPEYPEPSALNLTEENTNRNNEERYEVSDVRLANETQEEEKRRAVKIGGKEIIERSDTSSENEEEIVPRSRSRANSRRTKRRGKSRSGTRKDKRSQHKEARSSPSRHDSDEENHSEDVSSLRRPRSAGNRNANKPRERAGPPSSRRGSRQSEENVKSTRARKREHERSNSRGLSPYDGESSRKRFHSHRPVTPTVSSVTTNDQHQSKKKGKKRKRPREMSIEEMMRCKVELIDCKYTYLSPTMHPKILKKLGISRINRYVSPSPITENLSPPVLTRNETPSPPTLSKAVEMEYSRKETDDIIEKIDISQELEKSVPEKKIIEEEMMGDDVEVAELEQVRIPTPNECQIVKENVDDDEDDEDEDDDDDNIQIVKVLDENLPITPQGVEEDDVESLKDMEQDESSQIDDNENRPELIAVEEDYDTAEEYEVIDEVTDENEEEPEEIQAEVQVIEPTENQPTAVKENTTEPEQIFQSENSDNENEPRRTRYTVHKGPILDIKVLEDSFLAASEDGAIYRYSQTSNGILNIYKGHEAAVTCIYVLEMPGNRWNLYSGSLDGTFRCYDITTGAQDRLANVGSPVQCMDQGWGIIYIGTKSGHISRYNIKAGGLKGDRLEFSDKSVLALKASAEGPRRVLIVASRNQPITIRDANTGLFLRTICGYKNHTVYSLMRDRNLVYCGTSSTSIPVYDFTNGEQMTQYNAGVGIVCMRLYRQILFAGCYDGNIYVFDTLESKLLCSIPGPGNMLLSMEVVNDEIIAGSKNRQLHSWRMPKKVRALLAERT